MKTSEKIIAAMLCGAVIMTASGCNNTANALIIDGEEIRAGIYIYYQLDALNEAATKLGEEQPDLDMYAEDFDITKQTVEGINAEEWIKNKTIENCKKHVAVNRSFDEYGLSLTEEQLEKIDSLVTSTWEDENMYAQYIYGVDVIGEYYEGLGVGKQSYEDVTTYSYKEQAVFEYLYGEGGEKAVSAEELNAEVKANYALVYSTQIDPLVKSPDEYLEMINSGKSYADVYAEYTKDEAIYEINEDMKEAEEAGTEYTGTLPEDIALTVADVSEYQSVVEFGTEYPAKDYVDAVFKLANGETKVITTSVTSSSGTTTVTYYLVQRIDITTDESVMESHRETALKDMKGEEFDGMMVEKGNAYSITENAAAIKKYTVENLGQF